MNSGAAPTSSTATTTPPSTDAVLSGHARFFRVTPNTITATPASTPSSASMPFIGSVNEPMNVPVAMITTARRWSSAQAITLR